jgi:hypothetical protein
MKQNYNQDRQNTVRKENLSNNHLTFRERGSYFIEKKVN